MFEKAYATVLDGTEDWQKLNAPEGKLYEFDKSSAYINALASLRSLQKVMMI